MLWQRRHGLVRIGYPDGRFVEVTPRHQRARGEPARAHPARLGMRRPRPLLDLPRAGARASSAASPPPGEDERRVLRRIGARPNVRLACMLRPRGEVEVTPLLPPFAHAADGRRGSTSRRAASARSRSCSPTSAASPRSSEGRLPYDVVFVLNRYFAAMGRAVEAAGGRVDKFIGDGVMALFGVESDAAGRLPRGARRGAADVAAAWSS